MKVSKKILGLPASNGIVSGPVWIYRPIQLSYKTKNFCDPQEELSRLDNAVGVAKKQLQGLMLKTKDQIGEEEAQIFEAHKLILEDPELKNLVIDLLENKRINAEAAVDQSIEQYANSLQALDSEYFRERAQDVRDVGRRLILCLQGVKTSDAKMPENPVIILADEL
ncbi:phosphoenolpyruvate--protein phosphotransferase, partial [Candidatus Peregrinibacteria bacterium]|nr:phosphoenolpyruvate--protein phosphotransferase [Candidatus Peregrinibacteria bacterium]